MEISIIIDVMLLLLLINKKYSIIIPAITFNQLVIVIDDMW